MADKENKVQFNLKNVHYAVLEINGDTVTYGTPVAVPGAVTLTLSAQGDVNKFYADGITYYQSAANDGYSGSIEFARAIDQMLKDIWGFTEDETDHVLVENADVEPKSVAIMFQVDGDVDNELNVLYNCAITRPSIGAQTNEGSKVPKTQTMDINAAALPDGSVRARTTKDTPDTVRNGWNTSVYIPGTTA